MRVPALLSSVRLSRQWSVGRARAFGASDATAHVVELLTSEVVTNAVKYGHVSDEIDVDLEHTEHTLTVSVSDDNPVPPEVLETAPTRVGGQGMHVVAQLAQSWGWCPRRGGKRVWFTVALP
jgi:anti-sigma regulatory factor (Ser/Thr protein kinase)